MGGYYLEFGLLLLLYAFIGVLVFSFIIAIVMGAIFLVIEYFTDLFIYSERRTLYAKITLVLVIIGSLALSLTTLYVDLNSRENQGMRQELKIKHGIEDYHLVIKNKDNSIVYEKKGYFSYTKTNNQLTITDLMTKSIEIITINDDMAINVVITDGGN